MLFLFICIILHWIVVANLQQDYTWWWWWCNWHFVY